MRVAPKVELSAEEKSILSAWANGKGTAKVPQRYRKGQIKGTSLIRHCAIYCKGTSKGTSLIRHCAIYWLF